MTKESERKQEHFEERDSGISSIFNPILVAGQFLTLMPPMIKRAFSFQELGRAVGFFPLVGFVIGDILLGADTLLSFVLPPTVKAVLILAVWIGITGALHLDGLLDSCDGLFGGRTPEKRLSIMRDEHLGAYAFAGGALLVLLKFTALSSLNSLTTPLLLAPTLGRWAMTFAMYFYPYGREEGLGRSMKDNTTWRQVALATIITGLVAWFTGGWAGIILLFVILLITWGIASFVLERIPGLTGDIYGALCEITEVVTLLFFVVTQSSV
jgi:adenosylcobinamide-GDP ribazoletransferase